MGKARKSLAYNGAACVFTLRYKIQKKAQLAFPLLYVMLCVCVVHEEPKPPLANRYDQVRWTTSVRSQLPISATQEGRRRREEDER